MKEAVSHTVSMFAEKISSQSLPQLVLACLTCARRSGCSDWPLNVESVEVQPDLADVGVGPADSEAAGGGVPGGAAGEVSVVEGGSITAPGCQVSQ